MSVNQYLPILENTEELLGSTKETVLDSFFFSVISILIYYGTLKIESVSELRIQGVKK